MPTNYDELAAAISSYAADDSGLDVYDGDTLTVEDTGERVRLQSGDAAEMGRGDPMADLAKAALDALAHGEFDTVVTDGTDKYGRSLGDLENPQGDRASVELAEAGFITPRYGDDPELERAYTAGALESNVPLDLPSVVNPELQPLVEARDIINSEVQDIHFDTKTQLHGYRSDLKAGFKSGVASTTALLHGIGSLMGIEGGYEKYQEQMDIAAGMAPRVTRLEDIEGPGDFVDWMQGAVGQALPTMVPVLVGGGVGGAIGKAVAKRAIKQQVKKRIAQQLPFVSANQKLFTAENILGSQAVNQLMKRSALGGYGGAWLANSAMQSSGIYNELKADGNEDRATAIIFGAAAGGAETLADVLLFKRLFPNAQTHEITGIADLAKRIGKGMGAQGLIEGTAEGASESIQLAAHAYADPDFDVFSIESRSQVLNAFAAGAAAGLVFGAATETLGGAGNMAITWANAKTKEDIGHIAEEVTPPGSVATEGDVGDEAGPSGPASEPLPAAPPGSQASQSQALVNKILGKQVFDERHPPPAMPEDFGEFETEQLGEPQELTNQQALDEELNWKDIQSWVETSPVDKDDFRDMNDGELREMADHILGIDKREQMKQPVEDGAAAEVLPMGGMANPEWEALYERLKIVQGIRKAMRSAEKRGKKKEDEVLRIRIPKYKKVDGTPDRGTRMNVPDLVAMGRSILGTDLTGISYDKSRIAALAVALDTLATVGDGEYVWAVPEINIDEDGNFFWKNWEELATKILDKETEPGAPGAGERVTLYDLTRKQERSKLGMSRWDRRTTKEEKQEQLAEGISAVNREVVPGRKREVAEDEVEVVQGGPVENIDTVYEPRAEALQGEHEIDHLIPDPEEGSFDTEDDRVGMDGVRRPKRPDDSAPESRKLPDPDKPSDALRRILDDTSTDTQDLREQVRAYRELTGIQTPVSITTTSKLREIIGNKQPNEKTTPFARRVIETLNRATNYGERGRAMMSGDEAFIVINDEIKQTPQRRVHTMAHEFGHVVQYFFADPMENSEVEADRELWQGLERDYKVWADNVPEDSPAARARKNQGDSYLMREWLSDQFASWAGGEIEAASPEQRTYFQRIIDRLKELWQQLDQRIKERLGTQAESFEDFMQAVVYRQKATSGGDSFAAQVTTHKPGEEFESSPTAQQELDFRGDLQRRRRFTETTREEHERLTREGTNWKDYGDPVWMHFEPSALRQHANQTRMGRAAVKGFDKLSPYASSIVNAVRPMMEATLFTSGYRLKQMGLDSIHKFMPDYYSSVARSEAIFRDELAAIFDTVPSDEAYHQLVEELRGDTDEVSTQGKALRGWLDQVLNYYNEAVGYDSGKIERTGDYYPITYSQEKLMQPGAREEFVRIVADHLVRSSEFSEGPALQQSIAETIANDTYENIVNGRPETSDHFDHLQSSGAGATKHRTSLAQIKSLDKFRNDEPKADLVRYMRGMVHRAEQGRKFGGERILTDNDGNETGRAYSPTMAAEDLAKNTLDRDQYTYFKDTVWPALLGQLGADIDPTLRKTIGYMQMYQNFRTLLFSTLSSISDLGIIYARTGGDLGMTVEAFRDGMAAMVKGASRQDLRELGELMGVMGTHATNNILHSLYDGAYAGDTRINRWNDAFFRAIQLQRWTDMTRAMGLSAGMKFVDKHLGTDGKNSKRWMDELGVDAQAWGRWRAAGSRAYGADGRLISDIQADIERNGLTPALQQELDMAQDAKHAGDVLSRFVNTATLNPNASQRPAWASDPRWALFWHLKQFMYTMHTQFNMRMYNEMKNTIKDGDVTQTALYATSALSLMPLAMAGLAVRNALQYELWGEEPPEERQFGFDLDYFMQVFERTGGAGVGMLVYDAAEASDRGGRTLLSPLGPTVSQLQSFLDAHEENTDKSLRGKSNEVIKALPIASQIYPLRKMIGEALGD
jgi:hypothetical protein